MDSTLKAEDLLPLVQKLPHDEQVRLAKLAFRAATQRRVDSDAYASQPPRPEEFTADDDPLAWDAEGWDEFTAPR